MILSELKDILEASILVGNEHLNREFDKCGASDLMSDILAGLSEGCVLLTGLTTVQAVRTAAVAGVGAIVFVRDKTPPQAVSILPGPKASLCLQLLFQCLYHAAGCMRTE